MFETRVLVQMCLVLFGVDQGSKDLVIRVMIFETLARSTAGKQRHHMMICCRLLRVSEYLCEMGFEAERRIGRDCA